MPPDSWNGYCLATRSGLGILTSASSSTALAAACFLFMFWWMRSTSPIWRSTVNTGFSEVIGSWKMTEISLPRMWYISFSVQLRMSRPLKVTEPLSIQPLPSSSLMMLMAETDLPLPDSPTMPSVLPASSE